MATQAFPLGLLGAGEQGEIVPGRRPSRPGGCRSEELGLRAGKVVEVLANSGGGPLLLKVDGSRLALGRGMAMHIFVRRPR